ncbi:MAG: hypothetical protein IJW79_09695, partial [Clostridia bacterium]|nr:hypothetical protein [Clostridia bacterium]
MKNIPTKLLSTVLALLMVMSSLVTCFVFTASAEEAVTEAAEIVTTNPAYNLLQGIDFDDYDSSTTTLTDYLPNTGLWFTQVGSSAVHPNLSIADRNGNKVLNLNGNAFYINNKVDSAFNADKYAKSQTILDLLFASEGPKSFSISLDMTIRGTSGTQNIAKTSDNSAQNLSTFYRGASVITFIAPGYNWNIKATPANIPTWTTDENGYALTNCSETFLPDEGYLYAPDQVVTIKANTTNSMWTIPTGKTEASTGSAIKPEAMTEDNRVTYKLNDPFNVTMKFTRTTSSNMEVVTYIGEKEFSTINYSTGGNKNASHSFRLFDNSANVDLDNVKVEIDDASAADYQVEPVNTPDGFVAKYFTGTDLTTAVEGYKMRKSLDAVDYAIGSTIANNVSDILNGKSLALTAPASGSYWLAFDLNTPADYTVAAADLLTIGDKTVLATDESGKLSLLGQTAVGNALTAKNTYNVAIKLEPTATAGAYDVYLYVEGLLADTAKAVAISGSDIVLSANGVNLRNVKAVDKFVNWMALLPVLDESRAYVSSVEDYVSAPCVTHTPIDGTYRMYEIPVTSLNGSNNGVWSYICSECGVRVYIEQTPNVKKTFTGSGTTPAFENKFVEYSLQGSRVGVSSGNGFNASGDKYIFSYTLDLNNSSDIITAVAAKGAGGGTLIDFNDYKSALRIYSIAKKEDGSCPTLEELQAIASTAAEKSEKAVGVSYGVAKANAYPDAILIAEKISGKEDFPVPYYIMELGKQYQITLVGQTGGKTSTEGGIKVYINGELVYDKCQQKITTLSQFRCGDTVLYSYYSDLVVAKYNEYVHTCTDKWSTDCKFTVGDTAVKYTCTCYCGEVFEEYITSVVEDDIPYISEGATVSYTAPAGEYWLFTDANIPEDTTGTILSLGDTAVLEADSYNGNVAVAVKVNGNAYTLYVDGEKIADGTYTGATAFTFGENATFSYTKLVELGATDTPAVPKVNGSDCEHVDGTPTSRTIVRFDSHTGYRYTCSECGEVAYRSFNHN